MSFGRLLYMGNNVYEKWRVIIKKYRLPGNGNRFPNIAQYVHLF